MTPVEWPDPPQEVELLDPETFEAPRRLSLFDARAQTGGRAWRSALFLFDDVEDDR